MLETPLVSIVLLSYNYADLIHRSIESVLHQTFDSWEMIITDDSSKDNSLQVISRYAHIPNVFITTNESNLGIYPNAERGIAAARGKYIKILMADDWLHPDYLKETIGMMEKYPSIGLCTVRAELQSDSREIFGVRKEPANLSGYCKGDLVLEAATLNVNPIGNPSRVIFSRIGYDTAGGFDLDIEYCTEYDLWLRILESSDAGFIPRVLSYELKHEYNATRSYYKKREHLFHGEQMFVKQFADHRYFKGRYLRQQRVWLLGWRSYWDNAIKELISRRPEELVALIKIARRRSNFIFWIPFLIARFILSLVRRFISRLGIHLEA